MKIFSIIRIPNKKLILITSARRTIDLWLPIARGNSMRNLKSPLWTGEMKRHRRQEGKGGRKEGKGGRQERKGGRREGKLEKDTLKSD
jgi:hypothetical protein